jgi:hypothetical protein
MFLPLRYKTVWNCSLKAVKDGDAAYPIIDSLPSSPEQRKISHTNSGNELLSLADSVNEINKSTSHSSMVSALINPELKGLFSDLLYQQTTLTEWISAAKADNMNSAEATTSKGIEMGKSDDDSYRSNTASSPTRQLRSQPPRLAVRELPDEKLVLAGIFYHFFSFFNGAGGVMDVWEVAINILQTRATPLQLARVASFVPMNKPSSKVGGNNSTYTPATTGLLKLLRPATCRLIANEGELLAKAKTESRLLEASVSKAGTRKVDATQAAGEQLRTAAFMFARTGDFSKYCEIMIELNDWNAALAMAPCVSMEYWKSLCLRHGRLLSEMSSEMCIPVLLGIGKDADAVEFYLKRQESLKAMIVAKMSEQRTDLIPDYVMGMVAENKKGITKQVSLTGIDFIDVGDSSAVDADDDDRLPHEKSYLRDRTAREMEYSRLIMHAAAQNAALIYLNRSQPILAAAQLLAVEDVEGALVLLSNNFEDDLAYAVALCFDMETSSHVCRIADKCASWKEVDLACDMLASLETKAAEIEIGLLLAKHCTISKASRILSQRGLRSVSDWQQQGVEEEQIGSHTDAVTSFVIAGGYSNAVQIGITALKSSLRSPSELSPSMKRMLYVLRHVKASRLEEGLQSLFLCYMLWFGAHDAIAAGVWDTAASMLNILVDYVNRAKFPLPEAEVHLQGMLCYICAGDRPNALSAASYLIRSSSQQMAESLNALYGLLGSPSSVPTFEQYQHSFVNVDNKMRLLQESTFGTKASAPSSIGTSKNFIWGANTEAIFKYVDVCCFDFLSKK